jgi:hypothetical protein
MGGGGDRQCEREEHNVPVIRLVVQDAVGDRVPEVLPRPHVLRPVRRCVRQRFRDVWRRRRRAQGRGDAGRVEVGGDAGVLQRPRRDGVVGAADCAGRRRSAGMRGRA